MGILYTISPLKPVLFAKTRFLKLKALPLQRSMVARCWLLRWIWPTGSSVVRSYTASFSRASASRLSRQPLGEVNATWSTRSLSLLTNLDIRNIIALKKNWICVILTVTWSFGTRNAAVTDIPDWVVSSMILFTSLVIVEAPPGSSFKPLRRCAEAPRVRDHGAHSVQGSGSVVNLSVKMLQYSCNGYTMVIWRSYDVHMMVMWYPMSYVYWS